MLKVGGRLILSKNTVIVDEPGQQVWLGMISFVQLNCQSWLIKITCSDWTEYCQQTKVIILQKRPGETENI